MILEPEPCQRLAQVPDDMVGRQAQEDICARPVARRWWTRRTLSATRPPIWPVL
jgi:hypothetical protein